MDVSRVSREKPVVSNDICGTCLRVSDLIDITEEVNVETPISLLLEKYISPEFYSTPKCICRSCADEFININRFIEKCKRSVLLCASFKDGNRKDRVENEHVLVCEKGFDNAEEEKVVGTNNPVDLKKTVDTEGLENKAFTRITECVDEIIKKRSVDSKSTGWKKHETNEFIKTDDVDEERNYLLTRNNGSGEDKLNRSKKSYRKSSNLILKKIDHEGEETSNYLAKNNEGGDGSNKSSRKNRRKLQTLKNEKYSSTVSGQGKLSLKPLNPNSKQHRFRDGFNKTNNANNFEMVFDDETETNDKQNNFKTGNGNKFGLNKPKDCDESDQSGLEKFKVTNKSKHSTSNERKNQRLHELKTVKSQHVNEEINSIKTNNQTHSPKKHNFSHKPKFIKSSNTSNTKQRLLNKAIAVEKHNSSNSVQISTEVVETKRQIIEETQNVLSEKGSKKKLSIAKRTKTTQDWLIQSVHTKTTTKVNSEAYISEDFRRSSSSSEEDGTVRGRRVTSTSTYRSDDFDRLSVAKSDFNFDTPRPGHEYKCDYCPCSFILVSSLAHHKKIHGITIISKPYLCEYCGETFMNFCKFRTHRKDHSLEQLYMCLYCEKVVRGPLIHNNHIRYHTVELGELPTVDKLDAIEKMRIRGKFVCSLCGKLFANKTLLQTHLIWHPDEAQLFGCSYCGKTFAQKKNLKNHEFLHKGEKKEDAGKGKPNTC